MLFLLEMVSSACHCSDTGESCNAYVPHNPGIAQRIFGILIMCSNLEIAEKLYNLKTAGLSLYKQSDVKTASYSRDCSASLLSPSISHPGSSHQRASLTLDTPSSC